MKNKQNNLEVFLSSRTGKRVFNLFYSWGAAVVIIGAMFKIMHLQYADIMLMTGMITEALVFFISGFDNSDANDSAQASENTGAIAGGIIGTATSGTTSIAPGNNIQNTDTNTKGGKVAASSGGNGGQVVIVGGGGGGFAGNIGGNGSIPTTNTPQGTETAAAPSNGNGNISTTPIYSGNTNANAPSMGQSGANISPEYIQNMGQTSQNLDEFSKTMQSLNEASLAMVDTCKQMSGSQNLADNLSALNQNVESLNTVFGSITEQMSSIRYINDSLERMRSLYDGAIGDGYMFKEESAKMTRHIQALNNVYARLLQAMSNNNNNMNNPNNNPPVY